MLTTSTEIYLQKRPITVDTMGKVEVSVKRPVHTTRGILIGNTNKLVSAETDEM
jgi:hypothetical protein